jgi:hypothetical protein
MACLARRIHKGQHCVWVVEAMTTTGGRLVEFDLVCELQPQNSEPYLSLAPQLLSFLESAAARIQLLMVPNRLPALGELGRGAGWFIHHSFVVVPQDRGSHTYTGKCGRRIGPRRIPIVSQAAYCTS